MSEKWPAVQLREVIRHRKEFVTIDDLTTYKRPRVRVHAQGIVLRDEVPGSLIKTKTQQVCRAGEFLVAEIDAKVGGFGIVPDSLDGSIVSSHYFLFVIDEAKVDRGFLAYFIRTPDFREQVAAQGSTNYAAIRPAHVLSYTIPLPPLAEQRRIVERVETLDAKIVEARALRSTASEESEALFEAAIGKRFRELIDQPSAQLKTLTTKIGSGSTPRGGRATYPKTGVPFVRSMNVRMRRFQWDDIVFISEDTHASMAGTHVRAGDVLLNITGASIGRVACAPEELREGNVNQHVAIIRTGKALEGRFLMYWLSQPAVQDFINDKQKGATRQGFTKAQIEALEIPLLPLPEQRRIVEYLDGLQVQVNGLRGLQAEIAVELNALMPSVLDRAFNAQI